MSGVRLDKWLWAARFFKTRGKASELVSGGHVRVNGQKVSKPATQVGAGDVLTFPQGHQVRVVRINAPAARRGPAPEAQTLAERRRERFGFVGRRRPRRGRREDGREVPLVRRFDFVSRRYRIHNRDSCC